MYSQLYNLIGPQLLEVSYYPWLTGSFACYVHRRKALVFSTSTTEMYWECKCLIIPILSYCLRRNLKPSNMAVTVLLYRCLKGISLNPWSIISLCNRYKYCHCKVWTGVIWYANPALYPSSERVNSVAKASRNAIYQSLPHCPPPMRESSFTRSGYQHWWAKPTKLNKHSLMNTPLVTK